MGNLRSTQILRILGAAMKRLIGTMVWLCVALVAGVCLSGCGRGATDQQNAWRESGGQFRLQEEPAEPQDVIQLRESLEQSGGQEDIVLVGRIDGLSHPTWDPDRAAFMVADLSLHHDESDPDGAPKHDADNCPFCKAKTKKELSGIALVEVVDESGNVPPIDARKLLGLSDGQTVVVRGHATLDKLGTLVVQASELFVRPE